MQELKVDALKYYKGTLPEELSKIWLEKEVKYLNKKHKYINELDKMSNELKQMLIEIKRMSSIIYKNYAIC